MASPNPSLTLKQQYYATNIGNTLILRILFLNLECSAIILSICLDAGRRHAHLTWHVHPQNRNPE
jgi:hypothetical protein